MGAALGAFSLASWVSFSYISEFPFFLHLWRVVSRRGVTTGNKASERCALLRPLRQTPRTLFPLSWFWADVEDMLTFQLNTQINSI